jgi:hypothetical protein
LNGSSLKPGQVHPVVTITMLLQSQDFRLTNVVGVLVKVPDINKIVLYKLVLFILQLCDEVNESSLQLVGQQILLLQVKFH